MAFDLQSGYGAGAGGDMLQQILKQKALEFAQAEQIRMEQQRNAIEQQRANSEDELRKLALEDRKAAAADASKSRAQTGAQKLTGLLKIGQELNPSAQATLEE